MKVSVAELKTLPKKCLEFEFNETLKGVPSTKPVVGRLVISLNSTGVKLQGEVKTLLKLCCHRCLQPYFQSLNVDIDERFVHGSLSCREGELLKDDFVEAIPNDGVLDISDIVYQAVTLATPSSCLCGESCPGLPQRAGNASLKLNVADKVAQDDLSDPRWKNLKTLLPNQEIQEIS